MIKILEIFFSLHQQRVKTGHLPSCHPSTSPYGCGIHILKQRFLIDSIYTGPWTLYVLPPVSHEVIKAEAQCLQDLANIHRDTLYFGIQLHPKFLSFISVLRTILTSMPALYTFKINKPPFTSGYLIYHSSITTRQGNHILYSNY